MKLQVIDSTEDNLLLGTDWFDKTKAQWNFATKVLTIRYNNKEVQVGTTHTAPTPFTFKTLEENEDDIQAQQDLEYELEDDLKEYESYYFEDQSILEEILNEYDYLEDDNPVVYLTEFPDSKNSIKQPLVK